MSILTSQIKAIVNLSAQGKEGSIEVHEKCGKEGTELLFLEGATTGQSKTGIGLDNIREAQFCFCVNESKCYFCNCVARRMTLMNCDDF